jgi:hypothetical protein
VLTDLVLLLKPDSGLYSHGGQNYADDVLGVAMTGVRLQRIINVVLAQSIAGIGMPMSQSFTPPSSSS